MSTGVLSIKIGAGEVVLHLRDGEVVRVEEGDRRASTLLAQLAVRHGIVTSGKLTALLDDNPGGEVGRVLLDAGLIGAAQLGDLRALQVEELLGLLAVEELEGDRFDPAVAPNPQPGIKPIPLVDLIRDLQRRVAEWPVLRQRFATELAVSVTTDVRKRAGLTPREQSLVDLIGEGTTVGTLMQQSWWGDFITLRTLYVLLERLLSRGDYMRDTPRTSESPDEAQEHSLAG
jgi:hypothetical protein